MSLLAHAYATPALLAALVHVFVLLALNGVAPALPPMFDAASTTEPSVHWVTLAPADAPAGRSRPASVSSLIPGQAAARAEGQSVPDSTTAKITSDHGTDVLHDARMNGPASLSDERPAVAPLEPPSPDDAALAQLAAIPSWEVRSIDAAVRATATPGLRRGVTIVVSTVPGGNIVDVQVVRSSGDVAVDRAAVSAVWALSRLEVPADPAVYERRYRRIEITLTAAELVP